MGELNRYNSKYKSTEIQQLQHWYSKGKSKEICLSARNG